MKDDLMQAVEFSHFVFHQHIAEGATVVDATAGNGHDTLFLAGLVGEEGIVYAFDRQEQAIANTHALLCAHHLERRVKLIKDGHEYLGKYLGMTAVDGVLFNLGYLPGGDKSVVTKGETTVAALQAGLNLLRPGGIIVLVAYTGHPGGREETAAIFRFLRTLAAKEYNVARYSFLNQPKGPPQVLMVKKRPG
ncbi:MAG TPA: 16S rRNA (cytosine(1402)-N(4))-methyltransferase [Firmicutes bacterium]|nr:16S rRNA (cytosine(1402)-N(4))-methyltransferase [Bacillota bacterium]